MENSNKHIEEFLDYYLNKEQSPDYAVLITGCWGSGKTYFIKRYLGGEKKEIKDWLTDCEKYTVVYTSLFGLKNREEIDKKIQEIFRPKLGIKALLCHPNAISLVGNLAGIAVGTTIAATTTLATGGSAAPYAVPAGVAIGKTTGDALKFFSTNFIKNIQLDKEKYKKLVVVFDDVERADMPLPELLGYLNEYVEHLHVPCILLADKEKWEEAQKCQEDKSTLHHLSSTKEKVIGKEFQIQTSFDEVWNLWFNQDKHLLGDKAHNLLKSCHSVVKKVFETSGIPNFRSLKHSLFDFQRFVEKINDESLEKKECNDLLIADILVHQYAYYLGILNPNDICNALESAAAGIANNNGNQIQLQTNPLNSAGGTVSWHIVSTNQNDVEGKYEKFQDLFNDINKFSTWGDSVFADKWLEIWKKWLLTNDADFAEVNSIIRNSIWYKGDEEYYLRKMLNWSFLNDDDGKKALKAFYKSKNDKSLTSPSLIMDLFYRMYWYAKNGAFSENADEFEAAMYTYVSTLENLSDEYMDDWKERLPFMDTYKVYEEKNDKFLAFLCELLKKKGSERKDKAVELFWKRLSGDDYEEFKLACAQISLQYSERTPFSFAELDVDKFCKVYQTVKRDWNDTLRKAIDGRYRDKKRIEAEKVFLESLLKRATEIFDEAQRPLVPSVFSLYYLIQLIDGILRRLKDAD